MERNLHKSKNAIIDTWCLEIAIKLCWKSLYTWNMKILCDTCNISRRGTTKNDSQNQSWHERCVLSRAFRFRHYNTVAMRGAEIRLRWTNNWIFERIRSWHSILPLSHLVPLHHEFNALILFFAFSSHIPSHHTSFAFETIL